ncbi:hypothetical protein OKW41_002920 [Paraburkholderia sp. UCT70]|uniref:hypothetical protein n=1 Tax=Paraburkholderia sp. UCT70 TaxID=2991068 RepID=UPI003D1BA4D2
MKDEKAVQLLLNEERQYHRQIVAKPLKRAKRFGCLVTFAKTPECNFVYLTAYAIRALRARPK